MNRRPRENKSRFTEEMATPTGLEPVISSVTGWRVSRLHYEAIYDCYLCTDGQSLHPYPIYFAFYLVYSLQTAKPHTISEVVV